MAFVDLSMVGLQGQQAAAERMSTMAQAENATAAAEVNRANAAQQRFETADAEKMEALDRIASQRMVSLASGNAPTDDPYANMFGPNATNTQQSAAIPLEIMADTFSKGGAPSRAVALRTEAAKIRDAEGKLLNDNITADGNRLDNIIKGGEVISQTLGVSRNNAEWEFAKQEVNAQMQRGVFAMEPELWEQIQNMPYDQEVAAYFREKSISAKDKAALDLSKAKEARQAAGEAARLAQGATQVAISAATLRERVAHNAATRKIAGDSTELGAATDNNRDATATALIAGPFLHTTFTKDSPSVIELAESLEPDIRVILAIPGIDRNVATQRAIMNAISSGRITPESDGGWFGGSVEAGVGGNTADTAIVLTGRPDPSTLKAGKYYEYERVRYIWNGQALETAD